MITKLTHERKDMVSGIDHNLDLLKANTHNEMQTFLDLIFDNFSHV